jgi:lysophospholipase L1-like esterase
MFEEGRFDEEIKKADIITINVGGNDVLKTVRNLDSSFDLEQFEQLQTSFTDNLDAISKRNKQLNPGATLLFLELYNPLHPDEPFYAIASKLLPQWNLNIYKVASLYSPSLVIETTKVINEDNPQNLAKDGVHPNPAGYAAISRLMIDQLNHVNHVYIDQAV